jgi:tetratricopeptide (TPR) repeat protein
VGAKVTRTGRYVVLEEVGRGGMGRVLRAYDPKLRREVALKEVRSDAVGPEHARRLVTEARAMAKLSHPNVVAVYDVEDLDDGEVVLVMEYVPGHSLAEWLREPRTPAQIVQHFRAAGRGLAAAHTAGLLHRDFKPENVLVGADGRVRVTDFGLARDILSDLPSDASDSNAGAPVPDATRTETGAVVGTLPYLAPERLMGGAADTATDQFAFCVSLWEALYGARPFAGRSVVELAFAMSAGPPRPPAEAPRVAQWLHDTIARGLARDARQRWPNMDALIGALAHDPAHQRRRWLQAAAGIGVLAVAAVGVQAWAASRAQQCTETAAATHLDEAWNETLRADVRDAMLGVDVAYASDAWTRTEQALDAYASAWTRMHVEACAATTVRGEQSSAVMDLRMACLHRANVQLGAVTQVLAHADAQAVQKADALTDALRPLERCADVEALQADVEPPLPDEAERVEEIRSQLAAAKAAVRAAHYDAAEQALERARANEVAYGPVHTELAHIEGLLRSGKGDYEPAADALKQALRSASRWRQADDLLDAALELVYVLGHRMQRFDEALRYAEIARALAEGDPLREARVLNATAIVLDTQGNSVEAEAEQRRALALREEALGPEHLEVAQTRSNLATVLTHQGKFVEAEAEFRRALALLERELGPDHPRVSMGHNNVAAALHGQGKLDEAEAVWRHALAVRQKTLPPDHPDLAQSHHNLGVILTAKGEYDEAIAEYRNALAIRDVVLGPDHPIVATTHHNIGAVLQAQGELAEAEVEIRRALAVYDATHGDADPETSVVRHNLAAVLAGQGELAEAETEHRRALAAREKLFGPDHAQVAESRHNLSYVLLQLARHQEAEALQRLALAGWEKSLGDAHPHVAMAQAGLARVLLERRSFEEARRFAETAWTRTQQDDIPAAQRQATTFVYARALWEVGERARAIELAEQTLAEYVAAEDEEADTVRTWLQRAKRGT